jgi:hypothetical protein
MTNKIIAYSLWGNNPKYTLGAVENIIDAQRLFPDWKCVVYTASDVEDTIVEQIKWLNGTIIEMGDPGWNSLFWRFLAADSDDVVISRDTDSRLTLREYYAVQEWLESNKSFHIMRDHPYHRTEILGGMWGVRNGLLKGVMHQAILDYNKGNFNNKYQVDQNFLRDVIYPLVKDQAMIHDEFFERIPFPEVAPKRTPTYFVGQVYDEYNNPEFGV